MKKYREELEKHVNDILDEIEADVNTVANELETIMYSKDGAEISKCARHAWEMLNSLSVRLH